MRKKFALLSIALLHLFMAHAQYWNLTGNSGTTPPTNFIGTTDSARLVFKVNNTFAGTISSGSPYNTVLGYNSLSSSSLTGSNNTVLGYGSLINTTSGTRNISVGISNLNNNSTGVGNTAIGYEALQDNSTGDENIGIGTNANANNYTGSANIGIGENAGVLFDLYTNTVALGYGATTTASALVRIGNSNIISIGGYVNWSNISDGRFKKNIKSNVPGLDFVNQLKPVTYSLDITGINHFLHPSPGIDKDGRIIPVPAWEAAETKTKEGIIYSGFIAQDVETTAKKMGYDFSGVDAPKNGNDLYGLRYSDFVVPLVKSVQELSAANDSLKAVITELQSQVNNIVSKLNALQAGNLFPGNNAGTSALQQNAPNPFNNNTTIRYHLDPSAGNAQLVISDAGGKLVKTVYLNGTGDGQTTIYGGELAAGSYFYTLVVNGKQFDTKKMVLTK